MIDRKSPADPGHSCTCFPLNPAPLRVQTHPGRINSPLRTLRAPVAHPSGPGAFLPLFPAQPGTAPRTNPPWANEFAPPHTSRTCCAPQRTRGIPAPVSRSTQKPSAHQNSTSSRHQEFLIANPNAPRSGCPHRSPGFPTQEGTPGSPPKGSRTLKGCFTDPPTPQGEAVLQTSASS